MINTQTRVRASHASTLIHTYTYSMHACGQTDSQHLRKLPTVYPADNFQRTSDGNKYLHSNAVPKDKRSYRETAKTTGFIATCISKCNTHDVIISLFLCNNPTQWGLGGERRRQRGNSAPCYTRTSPKTQLGQFSVGSGLSGNFVPIKKALWPPRALDTHVPQLMQGQRL